MSCRWSVELGLGVTLLVCSGFFGERMAMLV
jgi:hypothetical protein